MAHSNTAAAGRSHAWNFDAVLDYMAAFEASKSAQVSDDMTKTHCASVSKGTHLGDFDRLWVGLGKPVQAPMSIPVTPTARRTVRFSSPEITTWPSSTSCMQKSASDTASSDDDDDDLADDGMVSTPPSSVPEDEGAIEAMRASMRSSIKSSSPKKKSKQHPEVKASQRRRDVISTLVTSTIDRGTHIETNLENAAASQCLSRSRQRQSDDIFLLSDSDTDLETRHTPKLGASQPRPIYHQSKAAHLVPRSHPMVLPTSVISQADQFDLLARKLRRQYPGTPQHGNLHLNKSSTNGIHVFVDISNIIISFYEKLKQSRGIHKNEPLTGVPFSFASLAMILERGRSVARRVIVGSHRASLNAEQPKRPSYLLDAEASGYEINLLERVLKYKPVRSVKRRQPSGNGYATVSGCSSGEESSPMTKVMSEQAVDEILHMKLLESLVDTMEPATIVLASGDAAEAEFSGGFLKNVERALSKGWKVEIVAWHDNMSYEYRSADFLKRWKHQVRIIELDGYLEELLAIYLA